jgi:predicted nucleotidyltransferase
MEPLAKLFGSPVRLKILRLFVFNQDNAFTPTEVTERTKLSKEVARRELGELCASGLLHKKGVRASARYQVNPRFEHLAALTVFIRETTSVRPRVIIGALRRAGMLQLVVLSGFFTSVIESQIDLLVVGDHLEERTLLQAVHSLEAELGREIRYASFATSDFRYRNGVYDRLLRDVFDYPHRLLIDKIGL